MRNFKYLCYLMLITTSIVQSQTVSNPIRNLCYKTIVTERQKIVSTSDFSLLQTSEILNFRTKTAVKKIRKYFVNGYYTHDIVYLNHENYFAKWYMVADTIRSNNEGTFSIFTSYNQNLIGGWGGANYTGRNANGVYGDSRGGSGYPWNHYKTSHTTQGYQNYLAESQAYYQFGFLKKITFTIPTTQLIQYYTNLGYTVQSTTTQIKIYNTEVSFTWILNDKILITEFFETTGTLKHKVVSEYTYNLVFGENILTKRSTTTPVTYSSGDCGENEVIETFTEYNSTCEFADIRSSKLDKQITTKINLSPNPATNLLSVSLSSNNENEYISDVSVFNIEGRIIKQIVLHTNQSELSIDINDVPSGYYVIKIGTSLGNQFNENFIKQ